jgi:hypothetical protein
MNKETELNDLMSSMTWNEIVEVEDIVGEAIDEWEFSKKKARVAFAMQYMMAKRNKPELTVDEAGKMEIGSLMALSQPGALPKAQQS